MGNCLVTKLKGVINNDNLPYFDAIVVSFKRTSSEVLSENLGFTYTQWGFAPYTVEILSGSAHLTDETGTPNWGTSHLFTGYSFMVYDGPVGEEVKIKVSSKDAIYFFEARNNANVVQKIRVEDFCFSQNLKCIRIFDQAVSFIGDAYFHNLPALENLYVQKPASVDLATCPNLHVLDGFFTVTETELASMTQLTAIYLPIFTAGDYLSFINTKRGLGYTEGSLYCRINGFTFNAHEIVPKNMNLTWDATSIILKVGNKIDGNEAYTYGATAAQISALEADGYVVTQVD